MFLKLFVPPLVPFLLLVGLLLSVLLGPVEYLDGQIDNAPVLGAGMLLIVSPVYFLLCFFLNAVDSCFDEKGGGLKPWIWSLFFCAVLISIFAWWRTLDELMFIAISVAVTILPMTLVRRLIGYRSGAAVGSLWSRFVGSLGDL